MKNSEVWIIFKPVKFKITTVMSEFLKESAKKGVRGEEVFLNPYAML